MSSLAKISVSRESGTEQLARQWVIAFAELYRVSLRKRGPRFVDLWVSALSDLDPAVLDAACRRTMQVCKFFPTPAEVREHIDRAQKTTAAIDEEIAWQKVLDHCRIHVWRDGGKTGPRLSDAIEFAVKCAGGWFYIEDCSENDLVFAKQRFIGALSKWRDGSECFGQLPDGQVKQLIAGLAGEKQLPWSKSYEAARAHSFAQAKKSEGSDAGLQRAVRAIRALGENSGPRPPARSIEEQKAMLRSRGLLPA